MAGVVNIDKDSTVEPDESMRKRMLGMKSSKGSKRMKRGSKRRGRRKAMRY